MRNARFWLQVKNLALVSICQMSKISFTLAFPYPKMNLFKKLDELAAKLVADGILRGGGVMGKFMISTFTDLILRVALAVALSKTALGATGIWCAWPVGWSVATVLSVLFYKQGYWNRAAAEKE